MYLIKELGLEKCKQIVDGAPDWSNSYDLKGKDYWKGGVFATAVSIDDLRTAIANHDLTVSNLSQNDKQIDLSIKKDIEDHCTDIRNHISPLTGVIER